LEYLFLPALLFRPMATSGFWAKRVQGIGKHSSPPNFAVSRKYLEKGFNYFSSPYKFNITF